MSPAETRTTFLENLKKSIKKDPRIVGLVDYRSSSEGRSDEWSDIDVALFIKDSAFKDFSNNWKQWAAQFGKLLLAYKSGVGHPWTVYEAIPMPLRVDFAFWKESEIDVLFAWPNSPTDAKNMVLYDALDGKLIANAQKLVGQSQAPPNLQDAFDQVSGDFWYYILRTLGKLKRKQTFAAWHDFSFIIIGNLLALLRIEANAMDKWRAQSSAVDIETVITASRLKQLVDCTPQVSDEGIRSALEKASRLGIEVCDSIAQDKKYDWPKELANRIVEIVSKY